MTWQHLRDTTPIARKEHRCLLCALPIAVGEKHVMRAGVSDGEFSQFRMHVACEAVTQDWDEMDWECGAYGAEFREMLSATRGATP